MDKAKAKKKIEKHFAEIMKALGLDLSNDSLIDTPKRVAKMYVDEIFSSLFCDEPKIMTQKNAFNYKDIILQKNVSIKSMCEHHFIPVIGVCHIAYLPKDRLIGLSKLNRIAEYHASKPQVQEKLTMGIYNSISKILKSKDVAVYISSTHFCVTMRGVKHDSNMITSKFGGKLNKKENREMLLRLINSK